MAIVNRYGRMWARNSENLQKLASEQQKAKLEGVYILYDGSMPIYVGKGAIVSRLNGHQHVGRKKHFWDYFSWFEISNKQNRHDVEVLLLKTLPYYLRLFNKQAGSFTTKNKIEKAKENRPEAIDKPRSLRGSKKRI